MPSVRTFRYVTDLFFHCMDRLAPPAISNFKLRIEQFDFTMDVKLPIWKNVEPLASFLTMLSSLIRFIHIASCYNGIIFVCST